MIRTVVLTRPQGSSDRSRRLAARVTADGMHVIELPLLVSEPLVLSEEDAQLVRESLSSKDSWVVFLSPTAVYVWREILQEMSPELLSLSTYRIAAQGTGTASAVKECFSVAPHFIPRVFVAEEFAREFLGVVLPGQRVLVPQSADGRDVFAPVLRAEKVDARAIATYRLLHLPLSPDRRAAFDGAADEETVVVFMSPSAVEAAVKELGEGLRTKRLLSVGPITSRAIVASGLTVWREAREHSEDGILDILKGEKTDKSG